MAMNISENGVINIENFEGFREDAYKDAGEGVPTIGFGHTVGVKMSEKITRAQAEALLKSDLKGFVADVNKLVKVPINQNQFDALVSFAYNLGPGTLQKSDLLKYVNAKNFKAAANEFTAYDHAGGKVLPGLLRRREAEKALFLKAVPAPKPVPKPAPKPATPVYHVVTKGQTLSVIAATYKTTVANIEKLNGIKNPNKLYIGQRLRVK